VKAEFTKQKALALVYAGAVFVIAIALSSITGSAEVFYLVWAIGFIGSLIPVARWAARKLGRG
jgi:hypothetical protein